MFRPTLLPLVVLAGLMLVTGLHGAGADDETAKLKQELKKREAELADAQKRLAQSLADLAAAKQELAQALASLTKVATAAAAVKAEIKGLDEQIKAEQEKGRKLAQQNKELREEAIKARLDLQAALEKNQQLLDKVTEIDRKLAALQAGSTGRPILNPPAKDLAGKVTAVDSASGQITVSLGKADGLAKGNTLEVYRLKPKPTYVGIVLIVEVREKDSVGKLQGSGPRGAAQVGDEVASRIIDK